jgi:O-antigen/teichoic acid export membrane protein
MTSLVESIGHFWQHTRPSKLTKDAGLYISGNLFQKAASFLLLPLWARFLTPQDYGITGTLAAYGGVLSALLMLGLNGSVVRHYYSYLNDSEKQKQYMSSVLVFLVVISGAVIFILNLWGPVLWQRYTSNIIPFDPYVRLMLWSTYAALLFQIVLDIYRAQQKSRTYVGLQSGKFVFGIALTFIWVVALRSGAYGVMISQLISGVAAALIALYLMAKDGLTLSIKWRFIGSALAFGIPLVPHAMAHWALTASDRIILEQFVTLNEIGLYNFGYTLGLAATVLVTGINQAYAPYYYKLMQTDPDPAPKIVTVVSRYIAIVGGICLGGILFAKEIVYLLLPREYFGATVYVGPIIISALFIGYYQFANKPLFHFKKTKIIPLLTGMAALLNIGLNLCFIPAFGAIAAAWTTAVSYGFSFVAFFLVGRRYQKVNFPLIKYGVLTLIVILSAVMVNHWSVLSVPAILIKMGVIIGYAILTVILLIRPRPLN